MALQDLLGRDNQGVLLGGSEIFLSVKTVNGAAGTFFSAGYTRGDATLTPNFEDLEVYSEQSLSPVNVFAVGAKFQYEFELLQNNLQNMRVAMRQAVACLTGAANGTLLVFNEPVNEYFQMKVVGPGAGTGTTHAGTLIDTYLWWNVKVRMNGGLPYGIKTVQAIKVIASILPDSTISGSPEFAKGLYGNRVPA